MWQLPGPGILSSYKKARIAFANFVLFIAPRDLEIQQAAGPGTASFYSDQWLLAKNFLVLVKENSFLWENPLLDSYCPGPGNSIFYFYGVRFRSSLGKLHYFWHTSSHYSCFLASCKWQAKAFVTFSSAASIFKMKISSRGGAQWVNRHRGRDYLCEI